MSWTLPTQNIRLPEEHDCLDVEDPNLKVGYERGLQALSQSISHDAMYDSSGYQPPRYQPEARIDALERILAWIEDPKPTRPILWLYGSATIGKSSLAQSITEVCRSSHRLAGSFFFRRGINGRDQGGDLFSNLAYQIAINIPGLLESIDSAMCSDPRLHTKPVDIQFQSLIVEPFQNSASFPPRPSVVIIDGLDECSGIEMQTLILKRIAQAVSDFKLPLQFIITSRPEPHIGDAFSSPILSDIFLPISLESILCSIEAEPSLDLDKLEDDYPPSFKPKWGRRVKKRPYHIPSYPRVVTMQKSNGNGVEAYARSLLLTGNGFPIWHPAGDLAKPVDYLKKGVSIGDVGILDKNGIFNFCFNIFLPVDDPIHVRSVPREFQPIKPGLHSSEIKYQRQYFKPGDIVTSTGVAVIRHSEDPLDISFSSTQKEGGILVLPHGASREDLVATNRFHEYTKRNAPHWYQVVNGYGGIVHTNGTLFLVTGCDKTDDWAAASFPYHFGVGEACVDLRYTRQPEYEPPWSDNGSTHTRFYAPPSLKNVPSDGHTKNQCVFIRGMRISLSESSWGKSLPYLPSARLYYTYILRTPTQLRLWLEALGVFLHLRLSERKAVKKITSSRLQLFHPNFVLGQVLLGEYPNAEVALVNDTVWCSLASGGSCTLSEIDDLVVRVLEDNKIIEKDGIVTLVPKTPEDREKADRPTMVEASARSLLVLCPGFRGKRKRPDPWVKSVSVAEHAKLFR